MWTPTSSTMALLAGLVMTTLRASNGALPAREMMTVTSELNDETYRLIRYEEPRSLPFRIIFNRDGIRSDYRFDLAGLVKVIKVGSERYEVEYSGDRFDDVASVTLVSSRRSLAELEDQEQDYALGYERKLFFDDCENCYVMYERMCDPGLSSVCFLTSWGAPFSTSATSSLETLCSGFGDACYFTGAVAACQGQCEEDEGALNPCLDPENDLYKCRNTGESWLRLFQCGITDEDLLDLPTCFESFGKTNIETLDIWGNEITTLPEDVDVFEGLTALTWLDISRNPIDSLPVSAFAGLPNMDYLYLVNTNLVSLPEGIFSENAELASLLLFENALVGLPPDIFKGLTKLSSVSLDQNQLTTLPEGLFEDNTNLFGLAFENNNDLQCVPTNTATSVIVDSEDILEGTCTCSPAEAVMCDEGFVCSPGSEGYTCESP